MSQPIVDVFTLVITDTNVDPPPILPTFAWQDDDGVVTIKKGYQGNIVYAYSIGRPGATAWHGPIATLQGSHQGPPTPPSFQWNSSRPLHNYDHDNNRDTAPVPKSPRLVVNANMIIETGQATTPGTYSVTGGIVP